MTGDQKKERNALDRLAEAEEDGIDPTKLAGHLREVFERAATEVGKAKIAAARQGAANVRRSGARVVRIDPADARRRYDAMIAQDPKLTEKLTLAARKDEGQSEHDIDSAIEDLAELAAFDVEDNDT